MIRFAGDACLADYIISGCLRREPALDFKSAASLNLQGKSDPEVLALAAEQGRILVTSDIRTIPRHFANFLQQGNHSPGVIMVAQSVPVAAAVEALVLVWAATDADEWSDRIARIPL